MARSSSYHQAKDVSSLRVQSRQRSHSVRDFESSKALQVAVIEGRKITPAGRATVSGQFGTGESGCKRQLGSHPTVTTNSDNEAAVIASFLPSDPNRPALPLVDHHRACSLSFHFMSFCFLRQIARLVTVYRLMRAHAMRKLHISFDLIIWPAAVFC